MRWRTVSIWVNLLAFACLVVSLALVYVWPEHLAALGLDVALVPVAVLQLISFVLLVAAFQLSLARGWRLVSLACSFVVLGEATAMAWLRHAGL